MGKPVLSTAEWVGAVLVTLPAIVLPVVCLVAVLALMGLAFRATSQLRFGRPPSPVMQASS